jgi:transcriptional regulator with XRE-family HTH domain
MLPFGKRVRIWRTLRGLSQTELSRISLSRLDQAVIARHESAAGTAPRNKTVQVYAKALRIPETLLTGEAGGRALQDIFRPLSPWKCLPPETDNRISADLKLLLPELYADLGLTQADIFRSELGSIAQLTGGPHKLILALPPHSTPMAQVIAAGLAAAFAGQTTTSPISVELYLALLLDPVGSLESPDLPLGLQLHPTPQVADVYPPPRKTTEVLLELDGDSEDIRRRIEACLVGERVLRLEVRRPEDFKAYLPDEVRAYLIRNNLELDAEGRLVA